MKHLRNHTLIVICLVFLAALALPGFAAESAREREKDALFKLLADPRHPPGVRLENQTKALTILMRDGDTQLVSILLQSKDVMYCYMAAQAIEAADGVVPVELRKPLVAALESHAKVAEGSETATAARYLRRSLIKLVATSFDLEGKDTDPDKTEQVLRLAAAARAKLLKATTQPSE